MSADDLRQDGEFYLTTAWLALLDVRDRGPGPVLVTKTFAT
jgi:hypothetical protein